MQSLHKVIKANKTMESGYCRVPSEPVKVKAGTTPASEKNKAKSHDTDQNSFNYNGEAAEEVLAKAAAKAKEIVKQAQREAKEIKKKAHAQGLEGSRKEGENEKDSILSEAKEILLTANQLRASVIKSAEPQVVELSLEVAKALVAKSLEVDKDLIKDIVAEAITLLAGEESILVKVNAEDLSTCRQHKDFFKELMTDEAGIKFLPAEDIERGSCIVQGQHALVESLLKERFRVLKNALLKEAGK